MIALSFAIVSAGEVDVSYILPLAGVVFGGSEEFCDDFTVKLKGICLASSSFSASKLLLLDVSRLVLDVIFWLSFSLFESGGTKALESIDGIEASTAAFVCRAFQGTNSGACGFMVLEEVKPFFQTLGIR